MSPHTQALPPSTDWNEIRRWRKGVRDELIHIGPRSRARRAARLRRGRARASPRRSNSRAFACSASAGRSAASSTCETSQAAIARGGSGGPPRRGPQRRRRSSSGAGTPASPCRRGSGTSRRPRREPLAPDVVIAPLVVRPSGLSTRLRRRLFRPHARRSLAASLRSRARLCRSGLETVYPQPHDIPMNLIVTEESAIGGSCRVMAHRGSTRLA